jgi:hypothetical protein
MPAVVCCVVFFLGMLLLQQLQLFRAAVLSTKVLRHWFASHLKHT